jgi:carbamoyltransferase
MSATRLAFAIVRVLGLSFSGHGTSVCLVEDGRVVSAVNLERLSRVKFALATVPEYAPKLGAVLAKAFGFDTPPKFANFYEVFPQLLEAVCGERDLNKCDIDLVVKTHDNIRPLSGDPGPYEAFRSYFAGTQTLFDLEHHLCHAYQAFLASPFEDAAILTIDGTGENLERLGGRSISTTMSEGSANRVRVLHETLMPNSVGALYSSVTSHLGFREEQEGNTMALAAFGTDRLYAQIRDDAVELLEGGDFALRVRPDGKGLCYFEWMREVCPRREKGAPFTEDHFDLAWSCQALAEDIVLHAARALYSRTGSPRIAMAGGVSLNCVANARILRDTPFEQLYVMPNAGDRGLALGAALYGYHVVLGGKERHPVAHDYLGPAITEADTVAAAQGEATAQVKRCDDIARDCAQLIADGRIVGWVQGGGEFGPRALGHRSILADPRTATSKERLDNDIKRREWFRPYAPSVLREHADDYFDMLGPSPYMLLAVNTKDSVRNTVPAIVHVDGSARVQTVDSATEPRYHRLISHFYEITGVPLILNTSFNGYGEPMVETPADALTAFHTMGLDALAIGDYLIEKK